MSTYRNTLGAYVNMSKFKRVQQWAVFSRMWYLYDATWQNPFESADMIVKYLTGQMKPIYHESSNAGDHVVVINCKDVAMPSTEWRYRMYRHHTMYAGGESFTAAWELHNKDPTKVLYKAVYKALRGNIYRLNRIQRLHLFPDDKIPQDIQENICDQIMPLRPIPKKLSEYTQEELDKFPKLFEWPETYCKK